MDIYWLQQTAADVPANDDWLSGSEAERLHGMRIPKRRGDWRLGRWTAKRAVLEYLAGRSCLCAMPDIEIHPAQTGAPEVLVTGLGDMPSLSISHCSGMAICAVAQPHAELGCDLESIELRSPTFVTDYFTEREQELLTHASAEARPLLSTLLWSAKESALKALRSGLRLDTRSVEVSFPAAVRGPDGNHGPKLELRSSPGWQPLRVCCCQARVFHGWWQAEDNMVRTMIASPPPFPPHRLQV
ncbi:MAG TPA: 4'-phosphopantetheinyl transferase superfamily protein [Candidatus Binatia bacterium]|nr:4'-phosphopantetheinyl transferase superfamily protein [Candidatus Binatia bacterium]